MPPFFQGQGQGQPPFFQGQGQGSQLGIVVRHYYNLGPLIHLISLGLLFTLFLLIIGALMCRLCKTRMRMYWRGYGCCQGRRHGHDHGGCQGHRHGHDHGHGCCQGRSHGHDYPHPTPSLLHLDALEILRRRYASGEIDDATFEHMRERLGPSVRPEQPPIGAD
jgi:hypothetical protein